MSLLNEVLRDIDLRKRDVRDQQILTSILVSEDVKESNWIAPILISVLLAICGLSTYLIFSNINSQNKIVSTFELPINSKPLIDDFFNNKVIPLSAAHQMSQLMLSLNRPMIDQVASFQSELNNTGSNNKSLEANSNSKEKTVFEIQKRPVFIQKREDFKSLVMKLNNGKISSSDFLQDIKIRSSSVNSNELDSSLARIDYRLRTPDELLDLLEVNRFIEKNLSEDRTLYLHKIYDQLRLKTDDSGYWAFQQAILYDKSGNPQKAFIYYKQALQTDNISEKQRNLSQLRFNQLQLVIGR